ncbi:MAG: hypothetical protein AAGB12_11580 [Pseudomonadota bacterium]
MDNRKLIISVLSCTLWACGGGSSSAPEEASILPGNSSQPASEPEAVSEGQSDDSNDLPNTLSFNFSGATSLITKSSNESSEKTAYRLSEQQDEESPKALTNLFGINEVNNDVFPVITSDLPIHVEYSIYNAVANELILVLAPHPVGLPWEKEKEYTKFIGENNCMLFAVSMEDNRYRCLAEGLSVTYSGQYSGSNIYTADKHKGIQFDDQGNVYLKAIPFSSIESEHFVCDETNHCIEDNYYYFEYAINALTGISQNNLYLINHADGSLKTLNSDIENIEHFITLSEGEVVYELQNDVSYDNTLYLRKTGSEDGRIEIMSSKEYWLNNEVVLGSNNTFLARFSNEIIAVQPLATGGVKKTVFDSSFGTYQGEIEKLFADEVSGKLFALFDDSQFDGSQWHYVKKVYQVLPRIEQPVVVLKDVAEETFDYGSESTPVTVTHGKVVYRSSLDVSFDGANFGKADVIRVVSTDGTIYEALLPETRDSARYSITNWRVANNQIHFSAFEQREEQVVLGVLDIAKFIEGDKDSLNITPVSSAALASNDVLDIEVIKSLQIETDEEAIINIQTQEDNLNTASITFSQLMDYRSLEALTIRDEFNQEVPYLPLWIGNTMNILFDNDGLDNSANTPLESEHTYVFNLPETIADTSGNLFFMFELFNLEFTTRPQMGWYFVPPEHRGVDYSGVFRHVIEPNADREQQSYALTSFDYTGNFRIDMQLNHRGQLPTLQILQNNALVYEIDEGFYGDFMARALTASGYQYAQASFPKNFENHSSRIRIEMINGDAQVSYGHDVDSLTQFDSMTIEALDMNDDSEYQIALNFQQSNTDVLFHDISYLSLSHLDGEGELLDSEGDILLMDANQSSEIPFYLRAVN